MSDVQSEQQTESTEQQQPETQQVEQQQNETQERPDTSWVPKRISEITAARRAAEARAAELEAELNRLRAAQQSGGTDQQAHQAPQPNQNVEELARAYAQRLRNEEKASESLNSGIARINEAGAKEFGDEFEKATQNLNMAGVGGVDFLKVLTSIDGAEKLVTYLGKNENIDEAMRISSLDPVQMGIEMMKLAPKAAKALSKQVSKVPPPVQTVDGGGSSASDSTEPDPSDTKKWVEWRNKSRKSRR
jgi:hypothetical protein